MPAPFLLIAFRFPPYDRIGAYRWSKLCGRLARRGHVIDVLTVRWPEVEDPGWFGDVQHENIRIHRLPSFYPHALRGAHFERRFARKLKAGAFQLLERVTPAHDVASLWGPAVLRAAGRRLDASGTQIVVATGAPFSANYWAARLRSMRPGLKLIQDFRDPWLLSREELMSSGWAGRFRVATANADMLVSVTPEMTELYRQLTAHPHVATVPNGVELAQIRELSAPGQLRYDFAYIGNLFNHREEPLRRFLGWVRQKKLEGVALRVAIAGQYPPSLRVDHGDLIEARQLELLPHLPQRQAFLLLVSSKIALQLNGPGALATFQTTTKLVEHGALRRPTLSLNYGGAAEDFIVSHQLGWSLRADAASLFVDLERCWQSNQSFDFDVSEFDFDSTAQRYSSLIDSLV